MHTDYGFELCSTAPQFIQMSFSAIRGQETLLLLFSFELVARHLNLLSDNG